MTVLKRFNGEGWETVGGITESDPAPLAAHAALTEDVHGIADTSALATATDVSDAVDGLVAGDGIDSIVALTQAAYDALDPPVATTLYVIVEP